MTSGVFLYLLLFFTASTLFASTDALDYQPFATRDQNVFNLIHGQALPRNAALLNNKEGQWSSNLAITNTLNIESNANESIQLDYESYRLNLSYQFGLNDNWNIKFDLPIIYQSGGFLDSSIDSWHNFFNQPEGSRPFTQNNQYNINYSAQGQTAVNLNESNISLGDLQISAAHTLSKNESTTISIWTSIKLPTGNKNKLAGNGAVDLSASLALNQKLADNWLLNVNTGAVFIGKNHYQNIPLADYALYGHAMLAWLLTDSISLKAQLQGHTDYYDKSLLEILGNTSLITFGGTIKINNCHYFDLAVSEDINISASPDVSFLVSWRNNLSRC